MSNPITTTGLDAGDISTEHQSGQSTNDWVGAHNSALDQATPSGKTLTTTWTSLVGRQEVETTRNSGESDALFIARHEAAYMLAMLDATPVP
jgi:hypothetical protein